MSETYCVVARHELTGPVQPIARAIAKATGKVTFDVTREVRDTVGVLASDLTKDQADMTVSILGHAGVRAFALPESDVVRFPDPGEAVTRTFGAATSPLVSLAAQVAVTVSRAGLQAGPYGKEIPAENRDCAVSASRD